MRAVRFLAAAALVCVPAVAGAQLSFQTLSTMTRTEAFNVATLPGYAVGTTLSVGTLMAGQAGTITFTYLGQESGYNNNFFLAVLPGGSLYENQAVGSRVSGSVLGAGAVNFRFEGNTGRFARNGGVWDPGTSIGLVGQNMTVSSGGGAGTYQFVIGYNDSAGSARLGDWDDFVVGVNFTPLAPIPEPETYALMLAGLGLLALTRRRRRQA